MIEASAPGRCGLLGNPSDIYGGAVLSCSLPQRATCRLIPTEAEEPPDDPRLWDAARVRYPDGRWRVEWSSDVPRSSGLAGSTALLAATLAGLKGEIPDLAAFADEVRDVEAHEAGIACGYQDAFMAVHGGLRLMTFSGRDPDDARAPIATRELSAELPFLLISTGVERLSGGVHGPMIARWRAGDRAVHDAMREIGALAEPGAEDLGRGRLTRFGRAMRRNHELVRDLGGSGEPIERLIARCLDAGAIAAKLAGAGLGGTVLALTEDPDALQHALAAYGYERFLRPEIASGVRIERR